jgi:hypothetical protein
VLFTSRVDARAPVRSQRSTLVTIQLLLVSPGRVDHLIEETWLATQVGTTLDRLASMLSGSPIPENHRTYTFISPFLQKEEIPVFLLQLVSERCRPGWPPRYRDCCVDTAEQADSEHTFADLLDRYNEHANVHRTSITSTTAKGHTYKRVYIHGCHHRIHVVVAV